MAADHSQRRRPIVLARIPRVTSAAEPAAKTSPLSRDAIPALPPQQTLPHEQRQATLPPQAAGANYFVDRRHSSRQATPAAADEDSSSRRRRRVKRKLKPAEPSQQANWGSRLCQFHAEFAPFAGVIVALALMASAGLLYWLIVGPSSAPDDFRNVFQEEAVGTTASKLPPLAPHEIPSSNRSSSESSPWTESSSASASDESTSWWNSARDAVDPPSQAFSVTSPENMPPEIELPEETHALQPLPAEVRDEVDSSEQGPGQEIELSFPSTSHPRALDFARLGVLGGAESPAADQPTEMPSTPGVPIVAGRSVPQPLVPISR